MKFFNFITILKKIDFLKEVLVAPMKRTSIFIGKIIGGSTDTLIQIFILLGVGFAFMVSGIMPDLHLNIVSVIVSLAFLLVKIMKWVKLSN